MAQFSEAARLEPSGPFTATTSESATAIGLVFLDLAVSVHDGSAGPEPSRQEFTVVIPLLHSSDETAIRQTIRGFVTTDSGTRAALALRHSTQSRQVHLPHPPCSRTLFEDVAELTIPAGSDYRATCSLSVERDSAAAGLRAELSVTSLELEMTDRSQAESQAARPLRYKASPQGKGNAMDRLEFFESQRGIGPNARRGLDAEADNDEHVDDDCENGNTQAE